MDGLIVQVYRNLHKNKWSVKYNGKVIAHMDELVLKDCVFRVQKAGRARVLKEKRKNVHAYIKGTIVYDGALVDAHDATYNPYKADHFFLKKSKKRLDNADYVLFNCNGEIKVL